MDLMSTAMPYGQTKSPTTATGSSADLSVPIQNADETVWDPRKTERPLREIAEVKFANVCEFEKVHAKTA